MKLKIISLIFLLMLALSPPVVGDEDFYNILQAPGDVDKTAPLDAQQLIWDDTLELWFADYVQAADIEVDVTNFDNNLGAGDDDLQAALDTLDDMAGGSTAYDDIGDPDANSTIGFAGYTNIWQSTLDNGTVFKIDNSDADLTNNTYLLDLEFTDDSDINGIFLRCLDNNGDAMFKIGKDGQLTIGPAATDYTMPTADGTAGYVLATGGAGAVTFTDPATLTSSGDAVTVDGTAVDTTAAFASTGNIDFIIADGGAGGPDAVTANINDDAIGVAHFVHSSDWGDVATGAAGDVRLDGDCVDSGHIQNDSIAEIDLDMTDAAADEDILTYESGAGGSFEWHTIDELVANITAGAYTNDSINNEDINWADIDYLDDEGAVDIAAYPARTAFESGDSMLILEAGVGIREIDYDDLPGTAEVNNLETVCTGIATTEIPIGTAADTVVYAAMSGEATMANNGAVTLADSVAVTSWNLTTPTITTSLTTDSKTISEAEIGRLDGLAGVIVTDTTACTDLEGTGLSITAGTLNVATANTTTAGISELATTAEIDTGTDSTRAMPVDQFVASKRNIRWLVFNLVEAATDCATATNIAGDFVSPIAGTVLQSDTTPFYLYATNSTAGTNTGTGLVVDISFNGTSIMTTNKLDFDTTEKTTTTAGTPPDLTDTTLAVGDIITIDIDSIHDGTAAKGLVLYMAIRE